MKKNIYLFIGSIFIIGIMTSVSCEKKENEPPPNTDCEINSYGTIKVINYTGHNLWVDVTWGDITTNYKKLIANKSSWTYDTIPAGAVKVWASSDANNWVYEDSAIGVCGYMEFPWVHSTLKSLEK